VLLQYHIGQRVFLVEIDIAPISELYIHEEIVESSLKALMFSLKKSGFQRDPIIVDEESGVILDGMHRYSALKKLGMEYITVAKVNYLDETIILRRWFRVYKSIKTNPELLERTISKVIAGKGEIEKKTITLGKGEELEYPDKTSIKIWLKNKEISEFTVNLEKLSLIDRFRVLKNLEKIFMSEIGERTSFLTEQQALKYIKEKKGSLVVGIPNITKNDVIDIATKGKVFPPKTTRHVIPARPLFVNVPLKLLQKKGIGLDIEEKREILERLLENKMLIQVKGKVEIDRLYEENVLFVFV